MASLNKVMVIGNLGADPEMRYTPNGNPVTSFSIAANRAYTAQDGERREETEWFNVVAWNQLAETCSQYLTKGRRVYVEGRLKSRKWENNEGQSRFRVEVIAGTVLFLDKTGSGESVTGDQVVENQQDSPMSSDPDDLPF